MDIKNALLEKTCVNLKETFVNFFDWNDIDVTFTRIDSKNRKINVVSSNYDWMLMYWSDDLDLHMSERMTLGIQYWNNYSELFKNCLAKTHKNKMKVDFCSQYGEVFEIMSINSARRYTIQKLLAIYHHKPTISDYAYKLWKKEKRKKKKVN